MNWDIIEGKWKNFKGNVQAKWGELTDDELDTIAGNKDKLVGLIQEKYGQSREKAQQAVEDWEKTLDD